MQTIIDKRDTHDDHYFIHGPIEEKKTIAVDASSSRKPYIFVKDGKRYDRIPYASINYIKAAGAYCQILVHNKKYTISTNLNNVLDQLSTDDIIRCHRSYAVNIEKITSFDDGYMYLGAVPAKIPVSTTYRSSVVERLPRLWM